MPDKPASLAPRLVMAIGGAMIILSIWTGPAAAPTAWLKYGGAAVMLAGALWRLLGTRGKG